MFPEHGLIQDARDLNAVDREFEALLTPLQDCKRMSLHMARLDTLYEFTIY